MRTLVTSLAVLSLVVATSIPCQAGIVSLSNKAVDGDGRYLVEVDDYGSIDGWTAGYKDSFNPVGAIGAQGFTFTGGTFLFVSNTHRELLSDIAAWQNTDLGGGAFSADASLARAVTTANSASDTNGDTFNDTTTSAFTVTGTGVNLSATLVQSVLDGASPGSAIHTLNYTLTNNGASQLALRLVRHEDPDSTVINGNADDWVTAGIGWNGMRYVGVNELGNPALGFAMWSPQPHAYSGLLGGYSANSGTYPIYATGPELWTSYGLPSGWRNHAAGIGYLAEGTAGPQEAGAYLEWDLVLPAGASTTLAMVRMFGDLPVPEPASMVLLASGAALGLLSYLRRRRRS